MKYPNRLRPLEERFWAKVQKSEACWVWRGTIDARTGGYGRFRPDGHGRQVRAHRVSWELANGPIPEGMHVLHRCDNPPCVRPDHLFLGTNRDNIADRVAKGRGRGFTFRPDARSKPRGSQNGMAKLLESDIPHIRAAAAAGESQRAIARRYGVDPGTVWGIVRRRTWRHVA